MAKLKPLLIGLTLGIFLAICYALRTIIILLFPNFVVNLAKKVTYSMISIQLPSITIGSFIIGIVVLFVSGFIAGIIFAWVHNWIAK